MDRVAVLVDAGYFFAAGSALVSGTISQSRSAIIFDEKAAVRELQALAQSLAQNSPLLRIYWYDGASRKTGPTAEHGRLAHCDNIKVRLGFINSVGQQKGVDSLIVTDLVELARNRAVGDVVLVSGDEDVRIGVQLAQSFGVRVHLVGIKPSAGNQSVELRQEADTLHRTRFSSSQENHLDAPNGGGNISGQQKARNGSTKTGGEPGTRYSPYRAQCNRQSFRRRPYSQLGGRS